VRSPLSGVISAVSWRREEHARPRNCHPAHETNTKTDNRIGLHAGCEATRGVRRLSKLRGPNAYTGRSGVVFKISLFFICGLLAVLSDSYSWLRGALWTVAAFSICLFPFRNELRTAWFLKAVTILVAIHVLVLWRVAPLFAASPYWALFAPISGEMLLFFFVLKHFDPLHGNR
jgi:hypothetical protein